MQISHSCSKVEKQLFDPITTYQAIIVDFGSNRKSGKPYTVTLSSDWYMNVIKCGVIKI